MGELGRARRRYAELVRELDVPVPFDIEVLCARVADRRGRPIRLLPATLRDPGLCGLWIASESADYLVYEETTSGLHQDHIVLHELGHVLCGHDAEAKDAPAVPEIFRTLEPGTVSRMLGRTSYSGGQEREAELVASLIRGRSRRATPPPGSAPTRVDERIRLALEHGHLLG